MGGYETSNPYLHPKIAIAVDEDVNIYDPGDVQWAVSTRVNPSKDIFIMDGTRNHTMDLSPRSAPGNKVAAGRVKDGDKRDEVSYIPTRG